MCMPGQSSPPASCFLHPINRTWVEETSISSTQISKTRVSTKCPKRAAGLCRDCLLLLERPVPRCVQATGKQHTSPLPRACPFSAARQLDHAACSAERFFGDFAPRERQPASPRPEAGSGSTPVCSATWGQLVCAAGLMRPTRAHGTRIMAIASIRLSPRIAHEPNFDRQPEGGERGSVSG